MLLIQYVHIHIQMFSIRWTVHVITDEEFILADIVNKLLCIFMSRLQYRKNNRCPKKYFLQILEDI